MLNKRRVIAVILVVAVVVLALVIAFVVLSPAPSSSEEPPEPLDLDLWFFLASPPSYYGNYVRVQGFFGDSGVTNETVTFLAFNKTLHGVTGNLWITVEKEELHGLFTDANFATGLVFRSTENLTFQFGTRIQVVGTVEKVKVSRGGTEWELYVVFAKEVQSLD